MTDSMDLGGSGGSAFSFGAQGTPPGTFVVGKVLGMAEVQSTDFHTGKPETWDNGDPKMQYRVTLATDLRDPANPTDDGKRDVYLDGSRKVRDNGTKSRLCAVLDAVRTVTGGTSLAIGGFLKLTHVSGLGFSGDPRGYEAQYQAPTVDLSAPPVAVAPPVNQTPAQALAPPVQPIVVPQGNPIQQAVQAVSDPFAQQVGLQNAQAQVVPAHQPATLAGQPNPFAQQGQPQQQPAAAVVAAGPTAEQVAAVKAAGLDPAVVYPGYVNA